MLASPLQSQTINRRNLLVVSPLRRHINTGNLAIILFVTLAVLSAIQGKDTEATKAALTKPANADVVMDNFSFLPQAFTAPLAER